MERGLAGWRLTSASPSTETLQHGVALGHLNAPADGRLLQGAGRIGSMSSCAIHQEERCCWLLAFPVQSDVSAWAYAASQDIPPSKVSVQDSMSWEG